MLLGLFLLILVIVKVITQYKYNKFNNKSENTVVKYRKIPYGVKDQFNQDSIEETADIFYSSFNNDLYSL
jgi:hypothetical protein